MNGKYLRKIIKPRCIAECIKGIAETLGDFAELAECLEFDILNHDFDLIAETLAELDTLNRRARVLAEYLNDLPADTRGEVVKIIERRKV